MRATDLSGHTVWKTFLGQTTVPFKSGCLPAPLGVASTATVAALGTRSVVYVGGTTTFYALDALTGQVIWKTSLGSAEGTFLWSSPAVYNGSVYEGISSWGDCPLVQGQVVQMSAADGTIQHTFNVAPPGCVGATVWGSPTIDETAGTIYFATANPGNCPVPPFSEPLGFSVVQLRASDLTLLSSWRTPTEEDFGSTPTLFTTTIGGVRRSLLGIVNKNGIYYAFDRTKPLSVGPVWTAQITSEGGEDVISGLGSISPSAWDGATLYVAGGKTIISGAACKGSLRALDPASGNFLWERCLTNPVLAAVTAIKGLAVVGAGPDLFVMATASGKTLFTYHNPSTAKLNQFWGAASISGGVIYQGSMDGTLFAFGPS